MDHDVTEQEKIEKDAKDAAAQGRKLEEENDLSNAAIEYERAAILWKQLGDDEALSDRASGAAYYQMEADMWLAASRCRPNSDFLFFAANKYQVAATYWEYAGDNALEEDPGAARADYTRCRILCDKVEKLGPEVVAKIEATISALQNPDEEYELGRTPRKVCMELVDRMKKDERLAHERKERAETKTKQALEALNEQIKQR